MKELADPPTPARGWLHRDLTETQVRQAVREFEAGCGIIKLLPDEVVLPRMGISWRYHTYESIENLVGGKTDE